MRKGIKILLIIIALIATGIVLGIIWQSTTIGLESKIYLPPGSYVDLDSYKAHYYSKGDGDTAFVFIEGSGTPCAYTDFYLLQDNLSAIGQTVSFDHAGFGWSSSATSPRTIDNLTDELSSLIDRVCPDKKIIFICHSLGSLEAISYTQSHQDKVSGIVFIDCGSPEFYSSDSISRAKNINKAAAFTRAAGINRTLGELDVFLPLYGENLRNPKLPEDIKELDKIMYYRFAGNPASLDTIELMNENAKKVCSGPSLNQTPTLILSSDSDSNWQDVQLELSSWSQYSSQITIKNSSHYLHWSSFDEVMDNISSFLENTAKQP